MERLTEKHYLGTDHYMKCSGNCNVDMDCIDCPSFERLVERLAAYEDSGLTPDEFHAYWVFLEDLIGEQKFGEALENFRQLVKADKDGRLVVLPCKAGDVMYKLFREYTECTSYQVRKDNYYCEGCMVPCDSREVTVIRAIQPNSLPEVVRYIEDIGKTVFLTREEAEKALGAME